MSGLTGRFLTRDPIGFKGSEWGLYELFDSWPLIQKDSSGLGGGASGHSRCCAGKMYDHRVSGCCADKVYALSSSCCRDATIIPSRTCQTCCNAINELRDFGFLVCCDGKWCPCNTMTSGLHPEYANELARKIIAFCVDKHEVSHIGDDPGTCQCGDEPRKSYTTAGSQDWNECRAYSVEYQCLRNSLKYCKGDSNCEDEVRLRMDSILNNLAPIYHCSTWWW